MRRVNSSVEQHDGATLCVEQRLFRCADARVLSDYLDGLRHQSKRLIFPVLLPSQTLNRFGMKRIAGEMKPADAFDGDDLPR